MSILSAPLPASTETPEDFYKSFVEDNGTSASGETSLCLPNQFHNGQEPAADGRSSGNNASAKRSNSSRRRRNAKGKDWMLSPLAQEFVPGSSAPLSGGDAAEFHFNKLSIESNFSVQPEGRSSQSQHFSRDRFTSYTDYESVMPKEDARERPNVASPQNFQHPVQHCTALQTVQADPGRAGASRLSKGESGSRKGQTGNANHLLNFHYNPITRVPTRAAPARRQHKSQPYNKEHFLQANFRFLVSDLGDYVINASDPDKMLHWEDVAAVECSTMKGVYCPICLENPPICSQITSCGHIFCFPCILHYFMAGEEVSHGDFWKKCPVCLAMINSKDLRSVFLDTVKEYQIGDSISFSLLNRAKGSIIPLQKNELIFGSFPQSKTGRCHPYSKLTLTSHSEEITNRGIAELTSRAEKAQCSGGEDLDQVQYIFAAIDQLYERQAAWIEHRSMEFLSISPPIRQRVMAQGQKGLIKPPVAFEKAEMTSSGADVGLKKGKAAVQRQQALEEVDVSAQTREAMENIKEKAAWVYENAFSDEEDATSLNATLAKTIFLSHKSKTLKGLGKNEAIVLESDNALVEWEQLVGNSPEIDTGQGPLNADDNDRVEHEMKKDKGEKDSYTFYQSSDGQLIILHPLNMKCLLQHYGDYDSLPSRIDAKILELDNISQSESMRRRYRFLSHFPLTATIQLCEVDLSNFLPKDAFIPFAEELYIRESKRLHRQKREEEQRIREEKMAAVELRARNFTFSSYASGSAFEDENATTDRDFPGISGESESLGISPPMEGRKLFSNVARLGFAAGHDAPALSTVSPVPVCAPISSWGSSSGGGLGVQQTSCPGASGESGRSSMSFADVIQIKTVEYQQHNGGSGQAAAAARKGKKSSKLIMSTARGRRY